MAHPHHHAVTLLAALVGVSMIPTAVRAARPMATDDAGVLDAQTCELEAFSARWGAPGRPSLQVTGLQSSYGVGWDSQLALAWASVGPTGQASHTLALTGKTRLNDATETETAFALAWGLGAHQSHEHSLRHELSYLTAVMTQPLTPDLNLHTNVSWARFRPTQQNSLAWSVGLEHRWQERLDLTADSFANSQDHALWLQLGLRFAAVPDRLYLDSSWGRQTGGSASNTFNVGMRLAF